MVPTSRSLSTRRLWFFMATLASLLILPLLLTASLALAQTPAGEEKPKYGGILRLAEREPPISIRT